MVQSSESSLVQEEWGVPYLPTLWAVWSIPKLGSVPRK